MTAEQAPMTEQADRAGGDGLLASYLEMMRAHVDDGGRLSHRNGCDLLAEVERLRAAPPSGNAGEGMVYDCPCGRGENPCPGPDGRPLCAPPQPAPDALREALREALVKIEYASRKDSLSETERLQSVRTVVCAALSRLDFRVGQTRGSS